MQRTKLKSKCCDAEIVIVSMTFYCTKCERFCEAK